MPGEKVRTGRGRVGGLRISDDEDEEELEEDITLAFLESWARGIMEDWDAGMVAEELETTVTVGRGCGAGAELILDEPNRSDSGTIYYVPIYPGIARS